MNLYEWAKAHGKGPVNMSAIAKAMEVTPQAVQTWQVGSVPAKQVLKLEHLTGIPRSVLNPVIYPPQCRVEAGEG